MNTSATTLVDKYTKYWWSNPSRQQDLAKSKTTFANGYKRILNKVKKLSKDTKSIDGDFLVSVVLSYPAKTDSRKRAVRCLTGFADYHNIELPDFFSEYGRGYTASSVEDRDIPSDELILSTYRQIANPELKNAYALMATYGLRPHEVQQLHWDFFNSKRCVRTDKKTKTGERLVFAIPSEWIVKFNIHPGMELPPAHFYDSFLKRRVTPASNRDFGISVTSVWRDDDYNIPFNPYDLRHAYALRTISAGLQPAIAAKLMGHSLAIHSSIYHRHMQLSQIERELSKVNL